jgi:hypothetical protein
LNNKFTIENFSFGCIRNPDYVKPLGKAGRIHSYQLSLAGYLHRFTVKDIAGRTKNVNSEFPSYYILEFQNGKTVCCRIGINGNAGTPVFIYRLNFGIGNRRFREKIITACQVGRIIDCSIFIFRSNKGCKILNDPAAAGIGSS